MRGMPDLRLELFTAEHLDGLKSVIFDEDVRRFTGFPEPPDLGFPRRWLDTYVAGRREGTREAFAAVDPGGRFLGVALAPTIVPVAREAELGYIVAPQARGEGVGTELLRQLTRWGFDTLGAVRLTLQIDATNGASLEVARRCGYVREGVKRNAYVKRGVRADMVQLARLASDPDAAQAPER
jgi:RimJ/RimL family protein N-acetyltransferase